MEQQRLEKAALLLLTKRLGAVSGSSKHKKHDLERLRKSLEEARNIRDRLMLKESDQELQITTVGRVVQARVDLEKHEKRKIEYIKQARGVQDASVLGDHQSRANEAAALKRGRVLKLSERISSFRLTGISCFSVGGRPDDIGLRFDATWGGHYLDEKYYVILSGAALTVFRHSLPYFIPIEELARAFLPVDPGQFCRRVSRYVCAYAGRRVLAEQLSRDYFGKAKLEFSESLDIITLTGRLRAKNDQPVHSVQLKFADVLDLIPHKADVFFILPDGVKTVVRLTLDRIPADLSAIKSFSYTAWVTNVLERSFQNIDPGADDEDDESSGRDEEADAKPLNNEEGED
jgi:hypothetical protein